VGAPLIQRLRRFDFFKILFVLRFLLDLKNTNLFSDICFGGDWFKVTPIYNLAAG